MNWTDFQIINDEIISVKDWRFYKLKKMQMIKIYKRQLGEYHDRESCSNALEKIIEKKNRGLLNGMKISK